MHIICPHCTTSYAIELATLGVAGRTVRCSRCRQVWLARPQDVRMTHALVPSMADGDPAWNSVGSPGSEPAADLAPQENQPPVVESPSISADWPGDETGSATVTVVVVQAVKRPSRTQSPNSAVPLPTHP